MTGTRWLLVLLVLGAAVARGRPAFAQAICRISTTPVAFGTYNVFDSAALPTTGSVRFQCDHQGGQTVSVYLSKGSAPTNNPRLMSNGVDQLRYNLYLDSGNSQIWGDPNPNYYSRNVGKPDVTVTVYALIPALQDVSVGSYSDTVVATINF